MPGDVIRVETDARGVATLWMTRAEKHNALNAELIAALHGAADRLGSDPDVRVVVLAGEGKSFCAGGDLRWMQAQMDASAADRGREARKLAEMLEALNSLPKPVIGRVHGNAFGGGVGLACICDVSIGVAGARFGLTETKLGLIPATIGPHVIARLGEAMARRVFMSSRLFDAEEAVTLGVIAKAVAGGDLDAAVEAEVAPYLACAPGAIAAAKALARACGGGVSPEIIDDTIRRLVARWETEEAREGVAAFFEKRPAAWVTPVK
ncbi:crotonase/enoyl-CoA hydratase family protein [Ovoidimarina sediminis]|uniref:crotonase/enoyl-CoA hydratase family protein n=1 Tax=Ovoidimarina sediminis TaxID=3079856 RepID=UPI00290E4B31|nr:crotonase/enoyl-CoA hydratase family protein [Rhodophyticola sp. MJ-SS7]MDU8945863.1 crotonase/enoyl-CoA hydratase family protein [Rhodophyticola sp. MJ-SS7]